MIKGGCEAAAGPWVEGADNVGPRRGKVENGEVVKGWNNSSSWLLREQRGYR